MSPLGNGRLQRFITFRNTNKTHFQKLLTTLYVMNDFCPQSGFFSVKERNVGITKENRKLDLLKRLFRSDIPYVFSVSSIILRNLYFNLRNLKFVQ